MVFAEQYYEAIISEQILKLTSVDVTLLQVLKENV